MSRKNVLNLIQVDADASSKPASPENKLVGQVASTVREEKARQARADDIERRLAEGHMVVDLDTSEIEASFVQDRMPGGIDGLRESIKEQGQQVPILVRPHPDAAGRYQVAFGHRRLRALNELGLPVKAVVRELTDEQLVVAQGQENNERQDLSYIEKARFADRLKDQFPREIITAAMSIDRPALSKMLSIIGGIPAELVDAIGPAPTIGRRNWQELVELVDKSQAAQAVVSFAVSERIQALNSDDRFKAVVTHLKPSRPVRGAPTVLSASNGARLGHVKQSKAKLEITIDRKEAADFAKFLLEEAVALYEERRAKDQQKKEA